MILVLVLSLPLLSGCWDRVELQNLAIITAAAIDKLEDGQTRISVQIFIPRAITSGETGEDPDSGATFVREGVGENLASAISLLQVNVPRRIFWGQCKIFILGEELAKDGIREELDYLARHPGPRGGAFLFVSQGEAKGTLELTPPLERYSAEVLSKLTDEEVGLGTTLRDVDKGLMGEGKSVSIPYIIPLEAAGNAQQKTIPVISATATFHGDQQAGLLDIMETQYLLWLQGDVTRGVVSASLPEESGDITMKVASGRVKYIPEVQDGQWKMDVVVSVEGEIIQNETHFNIMHEQVIKQIEKRYKEVLEGKIADLISKLQKMNTDVLQFGRKFHQHYPQEWKEAKSEWDSKYQEVEVDIDLTVIVQKPGYIGPPGFLPKDEVKE
ncbi:Ger(x)C family spore germination protein [Oceanobacillus luteolus]|uniref:Ger(x)C family spore germination protein n=1 Tax=Oceanobacillus luteolus TaxID=1274358 RepID=UPI002041A5D4|nr:Ger(x)C family spore germination protein [Oceanobacillus luteolus]MCM3741370.1 Ger(x)C family spore germination protein [Oceanobacillus luteolus]